MQESTGRLAAGEVFMLSGLTCSQISLLCAAQSILLHLSLYSITAVTCSLGISISLLLGI